MIPRENPMPPKCSCGGTATAHAPWCVKLPIPPRVKPPAIPKLPEELKRRPS